VTEREKLLMECAYIRTEAVAFTIQNDLDGDDYGKSVFIKLLGVVETILRMKPEPPEPLIYEYCVIYVDEKTTGDCARLNKRAIDGWKLKKLFDEGHQAILERKVTNAPSEQPNT
jgi:hypothetical protein